MTAGLEYGSSPAAPRPWRSTLRQTMGTELQNSKAEALLPHSKGVALPIEIDMKRSWLLAGALLTLSHVAFAGDILHCRHLPAWEQSGQVRSSGSENLFEYMDGNAEGYLIYGFVRMYGVTCKSAENTLIIDISEMTDADAAYGIFTANRDPERSVAPIGMGGQVLPRKATFAKDKFYVEISASPDRDHTAALQAFVSEIEKHISGRSAPPDALSWFPSEKLVSVRLVPESVLGLRALKRGYVAQYAEGRAFIVLEESPEFASAVMKTLRSRLGETTSAQVADEAFQTKDQYLGGLCFFRRGRYLAGYANLSDAQTAAALATKLVSRLP